MRVVLACLVLVAFGLVAAGCERPFWKSDPTKGSTRILGQRVWVTVTQDGGRSVVARRSVRINTGDSALDVLAAVSDVRLDPKGSIAQVNGLGGGALRTFGPEAAGWFYRVDGIESNVRPERFRVRPGQSIWWDLRRFDIYEHLPVAVGNFPQPMFNGWRETGRPLRLSYGPGFKEDAEFLRDSTFGKGGIAGNGALDVVSIGGDDDGGGFAGVGGGEESGGDDVGDLATTVAVRKDRANLIIGEWEDVRMDPNIIDIGTDTQFYGITVWVEGTDIVRRDPDMEFSERLADAEGLVWATTLNGEPDGTLVFLITGTTKDGVRGAVRALRSGACQFYIACAVTRSGDVVR